LEVIERELRAPRPDEIRVRVQAASVSLVDVQARQGRGPFQQKASFVPGYAVVGHVDALGDEVAGFAPGDRVAVLTESMGTPNMSTCGETRFSGYRNWSTRQPP